MKKLTKILALVLVLAMGVCVFVGCGAESKVKKAVEGYFDGLLDGDFEKAAKYIGDEEQKEVMLEQAEELEDPDVKKNYLEEMEGYSYKIGDIDIDDDEATVEVTITEKGGHSEEGVVTLEKIDGEWLIVDMD